MVRIRRIRLLVVALVSAVLLMGCGVAGSGTSGKLHVVTTTGMIADVVRNVGGNRVDVTSLMGPRVDPHLYKASEGDIGKLNNANIIFYNGLNLEGRMSDILVKLARNKPTIAVSEQTAEDSVIDDNQGHPDPHIWFDVSLWMKAAEVVRDGLSQADPANKATYQKNAAAYLLELEQVHAYAKEQLARIPAEQRVLVTAHDAFGYFGRAYDVEVMGLQGISTDAEYGLADVQKLVNILVERKVKAVFVESSIPKRSIEAVVQGARAKGHSVVIGGELFSDSMGEEGTPEGTYIGMIRHNVNTIVEALK